MSGSPASTGRSPVTSHEGVYDVAGWISPNPGGVGPMTRAMLLTNVVEACENTAGHSTGRTVDA